MKYYNTLIEEQETTINIIYSDGIIRVYSSQPNVIQRLIKLFGQPTQKYKKSKAYWSGASWDIDFADSAKIKHILNKDAFIDNDLKPIKKRKKPIKEIEEKSEKTSFEQIQFGI